MLCKNCAVRAQKTQFGINLGAARVPLGSRSGAVRAGFDDLYLERMSLVILFDRSPAL